MLLAQLQDEVTEGVDVAVSLGPAVDAARMRAIRKVTMARSSAAVASVRARAAAPALRMTGGSPPA
jgi:hypothetical protein